MIPLIGNAADGLNAAISAARGNYGDAALDGVSAIPGAGQVAGIGNISVKFGRGGAKILGVFKGIPIPKTKPSAFGLKVADSVPKKGVPKNWNKDQITDAITDYQTSIASRKAELAAFDLAGAGTATSRLAHARRVSEEEAFLSQLVKALGN